MVSPGAARALLLAGLLLVGQGLLVVLGVLDHEAPYATGVAIVVAGAALVVGAWRARPREGAEAFETGPRMGPRGWLVAAGGATAAVGVVVYNVVSASDLVLPEYAILGYGVALMLAAPNLHRRVAGAPVGTLVAYSIPLVGAPLALWGVNAVMDAYAESTPMRWYIRALLVAPVGWMLRAGGQDVEIVGDSFRTATEMGSLTLTVGVVCAGLYAMIIFLGVFGLFAWEQRTPPARLAAYLAVGLAGLHFANVLRILILVVVGTHWGGDALQAFHRHAGWVLFLAWSLLFWAVVLRRFEGKGRAPTAA